MPMNKVVFLRDDIWPRFKVVCAERGVPMREFLNQCIIAAIDESEDGSTFCDNIAQEYQTRKEREYKELCERVTAEGIKLRAERHAALERIKARSMGQQPTPATSPGKV